MACLNWSIPVQTVVDGSKVFWRALKRMSALSNASVVAFWTMWNQRIHLNTNVKFWLNIAIYDSATHGNLQLDTCIWCGFARPNQGPTKDNAELYQNKTSQRWTTCDKDIPLQDEIWKNPTRPLKSPPLKGVPTLG